MTVDEFDDAVRKTVGRNLRKLRTGQKMTLQQVADLAEVAWHTVYKWEYGRMTPSLGRLLWLCKRSGWRLADILGGPKNAGN